MAALKEEDVTYVTVTDSTLINTNNHNEFSPFSFESLRSQEKYSAADFFLDKAQGAQCELCFLKFNTFTDLYKHKGKKCSADFVELENTRNADLMKDPIMVSFPSDYLFYIKDALAELKINVKQENDVCSFVAEKIGLNFLMRRLYVTAVTKYNMEEWYPTFEKANKNLTAKTILMPLTEEDLKGLKALCATKLASNLGMERRLSNEELRLEEQLEEKLGKLMDKSKDWFVKLSTRSPKDAVALTEQEKKLPSLERLQVKLNKMKINTPSQVLALLAGSQRVFSDIEMNGQYSLPNTTSSYIGLILREFIPIPLDHEFRCFIKNRKVRAISQYQCYLKFESLQSPEHVKKIRDAILNYHDSYKDLMPMDSWVADVAVFPEDFSCSLIEFNPFGPHLSSGSALFSWKSDFELLCGKEERIPPPIRILKEISDENQKIN